jgi:RNA polymerase sigma-54 factor
MTQQLQQAIKLLQLNNVELTEFVNQELEKNPLLEKEDDKLERLDIENKNIDDFNSSEEPMVENISEGVIEKDNLSDIDLDNSFSDSVSDSVLPNDKDFQDSSMNLSNLSGGGSGGSLNFSESTLTIEDSLSKKTTLRDHIISQIHFDMPDKIDRVIALAYMEMLDETGYLLGDVEDVVKKLGCSEFRAKDVLWQLQQFDPAGIFSRSLKECLTLQLKDKGIFDDKFAIVLDNLGLLAKREYAKLKKLCDVGDQAIKEIVEDIKLLNPKPAIGFAGEVIEAVTPDVFVRKKTNGDWYVELNNATLPRVLINHTYHNEIKKIATTKDSKKFLSENMNSANWLVKILHQRATTILKVSTEIVKKQEAFF